MGAKDQPYVGPTIDLSGVPRRFHVEPDSSATGITGVNGMPIGTNQYNKSFSGADYHITAVIPFESDYQARQSGEARELRRQIDLAEAALNPSRSVDPAERQRINNLKDALRVAEDREQTPDPLKSGSFYKTFAELQTLSITSRRSIHPVRRLGEKDPVYHTRGPRTWAGTMVFIQLDGDVLLDLYRRTHYDLASNEPFFAADRIPPFNVHILGLNEYGHMVEGILFGVTLVATGQVLSIDDLYTEQQVTYTARHFSPLARREVKNSVFRQVHDKRVGRGFGSVSEVESTRQFGVASRATSQPYRGNKLPISGNPFPDLSPGVWVDP